MEQNINKYLVGDKIFNEINSEFIRLDINDIKEQNEFLNTIFKKLEVAMKKESPLFTKTFQRIMFGGSYYKGTRIGEPTEYDLNFVINLPFKNIEFSTDRPGYVKICIYDISDCNRVKSSILNFDPKAYKELNSFIDEESYLNQEKFRTWIEGILGKVANTTGGNNQILLDNIPIKIRKSGPAFTLTLKYKKTIDIDVVPVLAFSNNSLMPPKCSKMDILKSYPNKHWSVVPKPLNNSNGFSEFKNVHRYWRLCFYEFEKAMLFDHDYGRMKPVIRQLKKLRDTQRWASVKSYFLETLCYHEKEMFHKRNSRSHTSLFFEMLKKLHDAFDYHSIQYYWDDDLNLLENIGKGEMMILRCRLGNILRKIKIEITNDKYAIAKWILKPEELESLGYRRIANFFSNSLSESTESEYEYEYEYELESTQSEHESECKHCIYRFYFKQIFLRRKVYH